MGEFIDVAALEEIPPGRGLEVVVGDRIVALFLVEGTVHAIDGICAHAGGPLGEGPLHGCNVTCPWHGWQYDVTTGRHCLTHAIQQTQFEVRVENGRVLVKVA